MSIIHWFTPLARKPPSTQQVASDAAGGIGGEEHSGTPKLIDVVSKPLHRGAEQEFLSSRGTIEQGSIQFCPQNSWHDRVDTNAIPGPFDGERLGQGSNRRLAGSVRGNFEKPDKEESEQILMMRP